MGGVACYKDKKKKKDDERRGLKYDWEQPLPKSLAGWGHRWDYLVLNQGLLPSQGSSGTVMSAPGHREEREQTKG